MTGQCGLRRTALCVAAALLPLAAQGAGKCERLIASGSPDAPPYLWRDPGDPERLIGVNAELLQQVATQIGVKIDILYAGKRSQALEEVRSGRMDLLVDAPLTVSELESLDYVHPAQVPNDYLVWTLRSAPLPYRSLADLHGHTGAISAKARPTQAFMTLAAEHLKLATTENLQQSFDRLVRGEVEYVIAGRYSGAAMAQAQGVGDKLQSSELPVDRPGLYLALSHDSACNDAWLRGQLAKKMTELTASGIPAEVFSRNVERWKAQQSPPPAAPQQ
ncbi:transporter substrate-binding domain-containing protein [Pseudomonas sp. CFBP 8770]|uniref:substrate-binding periplasmic protein n=1 Tax=unclassified Pseudomonas TaxID=196821 RepID=UPI00177FFD77|nr:MULTISPECIES: transporter substrate-binding domain-containing protein [unclassified Pseudomonas]MBD8474621.1 transporter substrate-binding domain-containing protein [Pseudomonas sp. CFBP 8773]MBD8647750.1 transporter substrate-binding domain-containing protein [Pseudomonas sp. CFBP 8770]